jgi:hypothetical protein
MDVQFQERRRLNEEIERTFILTAVYARDIQTFHQTERGTTILALYEGFFQNFSLLVILTCDLPQLRKNQDEVSKARVWLDRSSVADASEKMLKARCREGVDTFMAYKKVLSEQSVIALPTR